MSSKAIITIGYTKYVLDVNDAVKLVEIMAGAELYAEKYKPRDDGGSTYHVWQQDTHDVLPIHVLPNNLYRMYKLAGKPEET